MGQCVNFSCHKILLAPPHSLCNYELDQYTYTIPFLGASTKRITLQDDFGNVRTIIVSDQTMQNVKAVIEADDKNPTPALYPQ